MCGTIVGAVVSSLKVRGSGGAGAAVSAWVTVWTYLWLRAW
jgi:hypothetical protein